LEELNPAEWFFVAPYFFADDTKIENSTNEKKELTEV
jgi:hypothetical protein